MRWSHLHGDMQEDTVHRDASSARQQVLSKVKAKFLVG